MLLPLVGAPLIDYTLEWLASNNVAEVRQMSQMPHPCDQCTRRSWPRIRWTFLGMHAQASSACPCAGVRVLLRTRRAGEGAPDGCRLAAGQGILPREGGSANNARLHALSLAHRYPPACRQARLYIQWWSTTYWCTFPDVLAPLLLGDLKAFAWGIACSKHQEQGERAMHAAWPAAQAAKALLPSI